MNEKIYGNIMFQMFWNRFDSFSFIFFVVQNAPSDQWYSILHRRMSFNDDESWARAVGIIQ